MDRDFLWMRGHGAGRARLRLPPGGVDAPETLTMLQTIAARLSAAELCGSWMMVVDDEVVGLCGLLGPPDSAGVVEIGYGVAASRRSRGHATAAVELMLTILATDTAIHTVTAATAVNNLHSQGVLRRNGFSETGRGMDPDDGETILWRRTLHPMA